jgi:hypothetical protein
VAANITWGNALLCLPVAILQVTLPVLTVAASLSIKPARLKPRLALTSATELDTTAVVCTAGAIV